MASTVYIGRDNPLDWVLTATTVTGTTTYVDADSFDRFLLDLGTLEYDSDETGFGTDKVFDISVDVMVGSQPVNALRIRLGLGDEIAAGSYKARLIGFNVAWPEGLVWQDKIAIKAVE